MAREETRALDWLLKTSKREEGLQRWELNSKYD